MSRTFLQRKVCGPTTSYTPDAISVGIYGAESVGLEIKSAFFSEAKGI